MTSPPCVHPLSREQGLLHGFGGITWAVVLTQSLGGILVAVCIKFADNILRTFAQTVAVLFGAFGSYFLFDFRITASFNVRLLSLLLVCVCYTHNSLLCTTYFLLLPLTCRLLDCGSTFYRALQVGMVFVGIAIVLYGHVAKTPEQSYRACVGFLCPAAGR